MKKNFIYFAICIFLLNIQIVFGQSFVVNFPAFSNAPTANPRSLTVAGESSLLQVQLDVSTSSTAGADVVIQLPTGVEYVSGSVALVSTNANLTITENGGTANAPQFKIGPNNLTAGNRIVFTIERKANCAARSYILGGGTFKDSVSATIAGNTTTENSSSYQVVYPVFSLIQPANQSNAVVGGNYTRTFTISNGGNGCSTSVYFSVDHTSNGIELNDTDGAGPATGIAITSINGASLTTPIHLTPISTSGSVKNYMIPAANLPGGDFCNGESIEITESYKLKSCNAVTNYVAGWGTSATDLCQQVNGTGSVSMATGVPSFTNFTVNYNTAKENINSCDTFDLTVTFVNGGTGNASAAAMYNAIFRLGGSDTQELGAFDWSYYNIQSAKINGVSVPVTNGTSNAIATIAPAFSSDPDGAGVGLADVDGDGIFDDLPGGKTVTIVLTMKVNCNRYVCNEPRSNNYGIYGDIKYNTMCAPGTVTTSVKRNTTILSGANSQLIDKSYAPANVYNNIPFTARYSMGYYRYEDNLDNLNTRHVYEITLPVGVSLVGAPSSVIWHAGQYPDNATITTYTANVVQVGNVVTITSNTNLFGWFELDMVVDCSGISSNNNLSVPYKVKKIQNINFPNCSCNSEAFCDDLVLGKVVCPGSCPEGGPSLSLVKVEREDNSLGWTDNTLSTHQVRSAISSYDLSKALYLDEFFVDINGTQNIPINGTPANNLYVYFSLTKYITEAADKIQAKSIDVTIKRGATILVNNVTLNASASTYSGSESNTAQQVAVWNLTSILPAGGLLDGDIIETRAHYMVIGGDSAFPKYDQQTGKEAYLYNLDTNNNKKYCFSLVPEMYLVSSAFKDTNNVGQSLSSQACNAYVPGGSSNNYARRFDAAGTKFLKEVRPGILPKTYTVTVDPTYKVNSISLGRDDVSGATIVLTPASVSGNTYTFNLDPYTYPVTVSNTYNLKINVNVSPSCATPASVVGLVSKLEYLDYYYHYKDITPQPALSVANKSLTLTYDTATRPAITITNQSGTIQASKSTESYVIRMSSTGTSTAPYTWLAIPTTAGVNVTQLVDISTNTVLTPITYSGGKWFKISTAGLASGTFKDYRLDFKYTTCNPTTFVVEGGWNCAEYPSDPSTYMCGKSALSLSFTPQNGEVQILTAQQPTAPSDLCTPINYEFRVNSANAGNLIDNTFTINPPTGLSIVPGTLLVEYPVGAGNWQAVTTTTSGVNTILDLTTHPNYPAQGLPGTLNDQGNANNRMIGIKFQATTSCNFVVGSNVFVSTNANKTCGAAAVGNGIVQSSNAIQINGADPSYKVATEVTTPNGFGSCTVPVTINFKNTIITSGTTTSTGYMKVYVPTGYSYASNTFACTSAQCPTFDGVYTDSNNLQYVKLNIPGGLTTSTELNFTLTFNPVSNTITSGAYSFDVISEDQVSGLTCSTAPGGTCSSVVVQTGKTTYNYSLACACYQAPATGTGNYSAKFGITLLKRAGAENGNWPMNRNSAHAVLESNTKGFVISRLTTVQLSQITNPIDGMMVYDTTDKCLKIYTVDETTPANTGWKCYTTPACP